MILLHHSLDRASFITQPKGHVQDAALDERDHRLLRSGGETLREEAGLGDDGFAGKERGVGPGPLRVKPGPSSPRRLPGPGRSFLAGSGYYSRSGSGSLAQTIHPMPSTATDPMTVLPANPRVE